VKNWGWSVFQWWDLRAPEKLKTQMAVDDGKYDGILAKLKENYPDLDIWAGRVDKRARSYFFVSSNGEVYTFGSTATISTIVIGNIKTDDVKSIVNSPALRADSTKFNASFRA
jgi:MoaA/NifB/PqqE/SkfB family radical SAM enzyme